MFFEFLNAVITLDLGWLVGLFVNNFHYLFFFAMICFFFFGPSIKKTIIATAMICVVAWMWVDFEIMSGWGLFLASFLGIYYITKIAVNIFAEDIPSLKNHMVLVNEVQFIALFVFFNLFMR